MFSFQLFGYHTALCLALLPLFAVALPTDVTGKSLSADATMQSVNSILDDIRDDEIVRSKRAGSGGFDLLGGLKSVSDFFLSECILRVSIV